MLEQVQPGSNKIHDQIASEWDVLDPAKQPINQESIVSHLVPENLRPDQEMLSNRINIAIEKLNTDIIPTREVLDSVKGFYTDYYNLGELAKAVLEDRIEPLAAQALTEQAKRPNATLYTSAQEALFGKLYQERSAAESSAGGIDATVADIKLMAYTGQVIDGLFNEQALAATTLGQTEQAYVSNLKQQYLQAMVDKGYLAPSRDDEKWLSPTDTVYGAVGVYKVPHLFKRQILRYDTALSSPDIMDLHSSVHAGQLYFHATDRLPDIYGSGQLATRAKQLADTGTYHRNTGRGKTSMDTETDHSNVVHFSHGVSNGTYSGGGLKKMVADGIDVAQGVIAITAADIIKTTPYYGSGEKMGIVTVRSDAIARAIYSKTDAYNGDDIFYASDARDDPTKPAKEYGYGLFGRHADGSEREVTIIRTDRNLMTDRALYGEERIYGSGENIPGVLYIPDGGTDGTGSEDPALVRMREFYKNKHHNQIVAPLRTKAVSFAAEAPFGGHNPFDALYPFFV